MRLTLPILLFSAAALSFGGSSQAQVKRIKTIAGTGIGAYGGDGGASTGASLHSPYVVSLDGLGNAYILDRLNARIRKIYGSGVIVTVIGTGSTGYTGDGSAGTSADITPSGLAVTNTEVYIADSYHRVIRKLNSAGLMSTIAGTGIYSYGGDGGPAVNASFKTPSGMAFDAAGNLYIADGDANVVRKINPAGNISTFAGTGTAGFSGDGDFSNLATLDSPYAVTADAFGNVFISDVKNNRVRKVDVSGTITTYAGVGTAGYSGDGAQATDAELNRPAGLATDKDGNLYIADADNNVIRMVATDGTITTAVGNGTPGFGGDYGPVNGCNLNRPFGVAVDAQGELYIADANNQRVRRTYTTTAVGNVAADANIELYPNPAGSRLFVNGLSKGDKLSVLDVTGRMLMGLESTSETLQDLDVSSLASGVYVLNIATVNGGSAVVRFVKE
ncbi:MAG: T9SS type A sorting domain-containing protein [Taibaiella sp.]|nr:T9SS type A sorting domain-containing protein [Taibaiella sp.]